MSVRRRNRRRTLLVRWFNRLAITYFIATGSASGVILGALIVNTLWPNHIVYQLVREAVAAAMGG